MKMEPSPSSTNIINDDSKIGEQLSLLPSENNNNTTAGPDEASNVAKTIKTKPLEDVKPVQQKTQTAPLSNSTDDSLEKKLNHVESAAEQSEVIPESSEQENDANAQLDPLAPEGAAVSDSASDKKVADAGISNDKADNINNLQESEELASEPPVKSVKQCNQKTVDTSGSGQGAENQQKMDMQEDQTEMVVAQHDNKHEAEEVAKEADDDDQESWTKMLLTEEVSDGNQVEASSPGRTEQSPSPIRIVTSAAKTIQQNGVTKSISSIAENNENDNSKRDRIATNGNDRPDEDEDIENSIKTEQEDIQSTEDTRATLPKRRMSPSGAADQLNAGQPTNSKRMKITSLENQDFQIRDQVLNNYIENMDCTGFEGLKKHSEQLLSEIQKLGELAKVKEREWNQILHQKKLREELLLRLQRAKQIMVLQTNGNTNSKHQDALLQRYQLQPQQRQSYQQQDGSTLDRGDKGRQGPLVDVQKMISDYRQTHPESIPRRGRRLRGQDGQQRYETGSLLTFSNAALGSGSQVRTSNSGSLSNINQDIYNEFSLLLSSMDNDRLKTASSASIKELLAQFARMSASERQDLLNSVKGPHNVTAQPTTYPEVTVHAVPVALSANNSLLHGILTKQPTKSTKDTKAQPAPPKFSPTLARLLTAPEQRGTPAPPTTTTTTTSTTTSGGSVVVPSSLTHSSHSNHHHHKNTTSTSTSAQLNNNNHPSSLSDLILSSTKARNEITITPVQQYEDHLKGSTHQQEDEVDDSADRLVIDEGDSHSGRSKQMEEETTEDVPQCQGCNHKAAQFVCAGCGNQWYCSRECQVSAWDEHSEVCSG